MLGFFIIVPLAPSTTKKAPPQVYGARAFVDGMHFAHPPPPSNDPERYAARVPVFLSHFYVEKLFFAHPSQILVVS